jgi:hypothetical protein
MGDRICLARSSDSGLESYKYYAQDLIPGDPAPSRIAEGGSDATVNGC